MKAKKLIIALTLTLTMGLGVTAYAATSTQPTTGTHQRVGMIMVTGMRGYDYVESVLKDKLSMTDEEITAGLNSGKTMYALAEEKGMTEDQFKVALLDERNKAVDTAIVDGTITNEEGASLKETLKNNLDTCTGIPGQRIGKNGDGRGTGHMLGGGMRGTCNCYINNTVE
ncbi:hypothetical protein psyc5s11_04730 [Clostridium gelidum]|uniref:DUF2680 domain-containing protein n=1 Tax=Clostridium gelidum TaxID=704125 RepID=A0ABM7SXP2_9CLOT|nr:hypothetical protein [Clostridium gelidum]BCZ44406.1 hypothetical protein psyc5s11_04730 [Clostridium gelidum]